MKKSILLLMASSCLIMTACNNEKKTDEADKKETAMSSSPGKQERNKQIIMASMESIGNGDIDGALKASAHQFIDYADGSMPPITNLDSLKGLIKMLTHSIEGFKPENIMLYADGDIVLAQADWTGVFKNDLMGIKATGKPVKFRDIDVFKLNEEGKIVEHSSIQNLGAVLMTAGMMK